MTGSRVESVDTLRGLTIAAMILVNNPGSWRTIWPPLRHAEWHGCTPTDLVFPFFVFVVGVAIALSLGPKLEAGVPRRPLLRRIVRRSLLLFALGLLLSAWPILSFRDGIDLHPNLLAVRIPGVLQRIALCYAASALAFLYLPRERRTACLVGALVGYWMMLAWIPVPGHGAPDLDAKDLNIGAWLDRTLLEGHLWRASKTWDPEGLLSTLPAVGTCLIGLGVGERLRTLRGDPLLVSLFGSGTLMLFGGWIWDAFFPINKPLWTSSYVLYSAGLAQLSLALLVGAVDQGRGPRWHAPFAAFGKNALFAFVVSGLLAKTIALVRVEGPEGPVSLKARYYELAFASWLPPYWASFVHALCWVAAIGLALAWLDRRGIALRV